MSIISTKYFPNVKGGMLKEVKGASIYTISTFLMKFGNFLIVPLFWTKLSVWDYGIIALIEVIGTFLGMIIGLQLDYSLTRFYYEWPNLSRKANTGNLWLANWACTFILGIISIYILSIANNLIFQDISFYPLIFMGLTGVIIEKFSTFPFALFRIINKPLLYSAFSFSNFLIRISLNIYFVYIIDKKLQGYFISNIISSLFFSLLMIVPTLRFATPYWKTSIIRDALKFSLPQMYASLISGFTQFIDRFLLLKFASIEAVGIYGISLKFTNLIVNLHSALKMSFLPYMLSIIEKDRIWGLKTLSQTRMYYILPLSIVALGLAAYIDDFVRIVDHSEYYPVAKWVPWLIGPALISSFTLYLAPGLFLSKRTDLAWIPTTIELFVVIASGFLLIPSLDISGIVITKYLSVSALIIVNYIQTARYYPIPSNMNIFFILIFMLILSVLVSQIINTEHLITSICLKSTIIIIFTISSFALITKQKSKG